MPNLAKADQTTTLVVNMKALARIHLLYLRGVEASMVLTEKEIRTHYKFIEEVEKILIGSGYMSEGEVRVRHTNKPEASNGQVIVPFPFM